jgi:hypothetical protein
MCQWFFIKKNDKKCASTHEIKVKIVVLAASKRNIADIAYNALFFSKFAAVNILIFK